MKSLSKLLGEIVVVIILAVCQSASAASINGGSSLLSGADANQLETWLGGGPITLNAIFSHTPGDGKTATDFHAAADGQGATFSVLKAWDPYEGRYEIIGGYDPQSWNSSGNWNITPNASDQTGFLFNLTQSLLQRQTDGSVPQYQTYNNGTYGPTFGGGHDLFVNSSLDWGYLLPYGYSPYLNYGNSVNILGNHNTFHWVHFDYAYYYDPFYLSYAGLEVFTVSSGTMATPDGGSTLALIGMALTGLGLIRRRMAAGTL